MGWRDKLPTFAKGAAQAKAVETRAAPIVGKVVEKISITAGKEAGAGKKAGTKKDAGIGKEAGTGKRAGDGKDAGAVAGAQALGALRSFSLVFLVLGLIHFLFLRGSGAHAFVSGFILLPLGAWVWFNYLKSQNVMERTTGGWVVIVAFISWYFLLGRSLSNLTYVIAVLGGILALYGVGTSGSGLKSAAAAIVPGIIFFLDVGLFSWILNQFGWGITPLAESLILFMPWWALLGFFCLPVENIILNGVKVLGVIYLVSVLAVPYIPDFGHFDQAIPGPEEFLEAEKALRERLPERENRFISNMKCIFSGDMLGGSFNIQQCVEQRQLDSELYHICQKVEGHMPRTKPFNECVERQRALRAKVVVSGIQDPTIREPTTAKFELGDYFQAKTIRRSNEPFRTRYAATFVVSNPRKLDLAVEFSCHLSRKSGRENVSGRISSLNPISFRGGNPPPAAVVCEPESELNGSYTLVLEATVRNMETISRLTRAFIGGQDERRKEELIPDIRLAHFPGQQHISQGPADFARVNFAFGNSLENPIIETPGGSVSLLFSAAIENLGRGTLSKVHLYQLKGVEGFTFDHPSCVESGEIKLYLEQQRQDRIHLATCFIEGLPPELLDPETYLGKEYELREFEALMRYDYTIRKEVQVEEKVLEATS